MTDKPETTESTQQRVINGPAALSIVAGSMLGIGIFLAPPIVARHLPDLTGFYSVWIFAAVAALSGAVACAELGSLFPEAGGDFTFQQEAYGPSIAFASGWVLFGAIFVGSIASVAVPLFEFQLNVLADAIAPLVAGEGAGVELKQETSVFSLKWSQLGAIVFVLAFTFINTLDAKISGRLQTLMTTVPIVVLAAGAIYVVATGDASSAVPASETDKITENAGTLMGWIESYLVVYFAYSGWNAVIYVAGEVEEPGRNIPLGLIGGTITVALLYMVLCWAFTGTLGFGGLAESHEAGTATAAAFGGQPARLVVTSLIAIAMLASLNATILGGARVAYAMAKRGAFVEWFAHTNDHGVPARALWLQGIWACLLITTGTFEDLLNLTSMAMMITGSLTVASVYFLRRQRPDATRPYKTSGYPWFPLIYLGSSALVVVMMVHKAFTSDDPGRWHPMYGLAVLLAAYVGHRIWRALRS
ncbi:MAG: APC family permease [Myxococcota bacterium]